METLEPQINENKDEVDFIDTAASNTMKAVLTPRLTRKLIVEETCIESGIIEEGFGFTVTRHRNFAEIIESCLKIDITSPSYPSLPNT